MSTTIYIPMPEWQGLSFLRNREEAFRRLVTPLGSHNDTEFVMENDEVLVGLKEREGAVQTGFATRPQGFTILRLVLPQPMHDHLAQHGMINGTLKHPVSKAGVWILNREGAQLVSERASLGEVEVLMDQIFGPSVPEINVSGLRQTAAGADDEWPDLGYGPPSELGFTRR